ncbi:hypothetical protein BDQ12DRAFT_337022 [Crucibulum laeve]|uniref:SnoaL-like domain-containing protein n=1 Tax=Crucibulum laeve TaxID=68775 RepID=A0A5C3LPC9_9AGAR|nr:hypothetical protein BDQ12DRAFT_337022 [Crucibulum laeve]
MRNVNTAPTTSELLATSDAFFTALANNTASVALLSYFSSTHLVSIQHAPAKCPHPQTSRLTGSNAIRSYFDLLATHWVRLGMTRHSQRADAEARRVIVSASVIWKWKRSGRKWTEDFTCTLEFDESLKIVNLVIKTEGAPSTCVMRAVDVDPEPVEGLTTQISM